ncbi:MAG TPA: hypothetical protein VIV58_01305 [Kofleriaceae bacterium]
MTRISIILLATLAALAAINCGDNLKVTDGGTAGSDAGSGNNFPAAPALGVQIDRLGRPAINTVLTHGFDGSASSAGSAKDAYNADGAPGGRQQYVPEFMKNLAILDSLDTGLKCVTGACTGSATEPGCGTQVEYNGSLSGGGTPGPTSYQTLAGLLSDDELFLDTTKTICEVPSNHQNYLAVEFGVLATPNSTCGGRAPTNDVIDTSFAALAIGLNGFALDFTPAFGDGADPHTDVSNDAFPFLGAPH